MLPQSLYSRLPRPAPRLFVTSSRRWGALSAGDAYGPAARRDDSDGPAPTHWCRTRAAITSSGPGSDAPPDFPSASDPAPQSIHEICLRQVGQEHQIGALIEPAIAR